MYSVSDGAESRILPFRVQQNKYFFWIKERWGIYRETYLKVHWTMLGQKSGHGP